MRIEPEVVIKERTFRDMKGKVVRNVNIDIDNTPYLVVEKPNGQLAYLDLVTNRLTANDISPEEKFLSTFCELPNARLLLE